MNLVSHFCKLGYLAMLTIFISAFGKGLVYKKEIVNLHQKKFMRLGHGCQWFGKF